MVDTGAKAAEGGMEADQRGEITLNPLMTGWPGRSPLC